MESWITSKLSIILGVLSGLLLLVAVGLYAYDMHLTAKLATANATIAELTLANTTLAKSVKDQNDKIEDWKKKAAEADIMVQKAIDDAAAAAKVNAQKASAILGYKGSGNDCVASNELISAYIRGDLK